MMTFRHRHIVDADPAGRRILRASSPSSLKPLSQLNGRSRFNLSSKACAFCGVIGIFAGTYSSSSSALAEAEESVGQEINNPGSSVPSLSNGTLTNLLINSYADEEVARYLSTLDSSHDAADSVDRDAETYTGSQPAFHSSTNPHGFDDPLIPEAVWSLDASTGAHLDHISGGLGSDIDAVFGGHAKINDFWIRAIASQWIYDNTDKAPGLFFAPITFQVASCGGNSAERSNLDYCNNVLGDQQNDASPMKAQQNDNNAATKSTSNNVFSSSSLPASNSTAPPIPTPIPNPLPVIAYQLADQSPLQEILNVLGPCDVSASCAGVVIDPLETPVDAPALDPVQLIGDQTPPNDAPPLDPPQIIGDQTPPNAPPLDPPQIIGDQTPPNGPATPEASTWVMTVVGFGFMAFTFRKRRRPRTIPSRLSTSEET